MDITFNTAIYLQEHKQEVDVVVEEFRRLSVEVVSNTSIQLTNFSLVERFIDAQNFISDNEITENTLKIIEGCINDAKSYISSDEFIKFENTMRIISKFNSSCLQHKTK